MERAKRHGCGRRESAAARVALPAAAARAGHRTGCRRCADWRFGQRAGCKNRDGGVRVLSLPLLERPACTFQCVSGCVGACARRCEDARVRACGFKTYGPCDLAPRQCAALRDHELRWPLRKRPVGAGVHAAVLSAWRACDAVRCGAWRAAARRTRCGWARRARWKAVVGRRTRAPRRCRSREMRCVALHGER